MDENGRSGAGQRDRIVVGASAGGVKALVQLVGSIPASLPAAILLVLHTNPFGRSSLPEILTNAGKLPAKHAEDGEPIRLGQIYVAPPNLHLLVAKDCLKLSRGPKENRNRPSIDALFRSAALTCGRRVIGVILSGELDDGTQGLYYVKEYGGVAIIQDPRSASNESMPRNAMTAVQVDHCLRLDAMGAVLHSLVLEELEESTQKMVHPVFEPIKNPVAFTCPECNGPVWETKYGSLSRFECRVGHAFSGDSMLAGQSDELERALWTAMKELEQSVALLRYLAGQAEASGKRLPRCDFEERAKEKEQQAAVIRGILDKDAPLIGIRDDGSGPARSEDRN